MTIIYETLTGPMAVLANKEELPPKQYDIFLRPSTSGKHHVDMMFLHSTPEDDQEIEKIRNNLSVGFGLFEENLVKNLAEFEMDFQAIFGDVLSDLRLQLKTAIEKTIGKTVENNTCLFEYLLMVALLKFLISKGIKTLPNFYAPSFYLKG